MQLDLVSERGQFGKSIILVVSNKLFVEISKQPVDEDEIQ